MIEFTELMHECGLSIAGTARLLDVRRDTVKNWKYGRCFVPQGVIEDLREYNTAAHRIFGC